MTRKTISTPSTPAGVAPASLSLDDALLWLGTLLTLTPLLVRATSNFTTLPAWDLDPLTYPIRPFALGPAGSMHCDAAALFGAAVLFLWAARRGIAFNLSLILLAIIGAAGVVLHGWILGTSTQHGSLGNQRIGAAWVSAIFGALAVLHAAQDPRVRRIFASILLGFVGLLAVYGAVQVFYVHAQTVADFNADPEKALSAHGWSLDSPMAKAFIRRLSQPEATAWFGLANVFASFAAAGVVSAFFLLVLSVRGRDRAKINAPATIALALFALACTLALVLAKSKGGFAATAGAIVATLMVAAISRSALADRKRARRVAGYIGLLAILAPIGLFMARGFFGEAFSELSLLFRSYYAQAAARIFVENPVVGVGPDDFQRAFTLAKPPLCPEDVSSPHCIPFDYLATLGVLGIAWISILVRFAFQTGANAVAPASSLDSHVSRTDTRLILLLPAAATILAAYLESPQISPDIALVRLAGLALWCIAAWAVAQTLSTSSTRLALAAAALALIAHAQIDITASFVPSCGLWLMLIAVAAAPSQSRIAQAPPDQTRIFNIPTSLALLCTLALSALIAFTTFSRTLPWQSCLDRAADVVRPIAEFSDRLAASSLPDAASKDSPDQIVRDLAKAVGHAVQPTTASVNAARAELDQRILPEAVTQLKLATDIYPDDRRPLREASRLYMRIAEGALATDKPEIVRNAFDQAEQILRLEPATAAGQSIIPDPSSPEWHWLAIVLERRAAVLNDREPLARAALARLRVAAIDPYNLDNALRLFHNYQTLGDAPQAKSWAKRCLELDKLMRLDHDIRGLPDKDKPEIEKAASQP